MIGKSAEKWREANELQAETRSSVEAQFAAFSCNVFHGDIAERGREGRISCSVLSVIFLETFPESKF